MRLKLPQVALNSENQLYNVFKEQKPVIIKSISSSWPAMKSWQDYSKLKLRILNGKKNDQCVVSVERGGNYMSKAMSLVEIDFIDLLDYFIALEKSQSGCSFQSHTEKSHIYLAQTNLKDIYDLIDDVEVPKLVQCTTDVSKNLYNINLWLGGPGGTDSPCHYDPFQNVLCQVFGSKTVLLFTPDEAHSLYPLLGTVQKNTSRVDFKPIVRDVLSTIDHLGLSPHVISTDYSSFVFSTSPSAPSSSSSAPSSVINNDIGSLAISPSVDSQRQFERFPKLHEADGYCVRLEPGDGLFIPMRWWHHCLSPAASCSVNFWWR